MINKILRYIALFFLYIITFFVMVIALPILGVFTKIAEGLVFMWDLMFGTEYHIKWFCKEEK